MIEIPGAKILARFVKPHIHSGVAYPVGATMECDQHLFARLQRLGAAVAVEVAIAGSGNIDMEAARAKVVREQEQAPRTGTPPKGPGRFRGR